MDGTVIVSTGVPLTPPNRKVAVIWSPSNGASSATPNWFTPRGSTTVRSLNTSGSSVGELTRLPLSILPTGNSRSAPKAKNAGAPPAARANSMNCPGANSMLDTCTPLDATPCTSTSVELVRN